MADRRFGVRTALACPLPAIPPSLSCSAAAAPPPHSISQNSLLFQPFPFLSFSSNPSLPYPGPNSSPNPSCPPALRSKSTCPLSPPSPLPTISALRWLAHPSSRVRLSLDWGWPRPDWR